MIYDIQILPFWILFNENIVMNAASHYNYKWLANLNLQISQDLSQSSQLRRKLHFFFTISSLRALIEATTKSFEHTNPSVDNIVTLLISLFSKQYHTDLLKSYSQSNLLLQNLTSMPSNSSTFKSDCQSLRSTIHTSISSFKGANNSITKMLRWYDIPSLPTSSSTYSMKLRMMKKKSMSKRFSVWILLSSYNLENLHGLFDL